MGSLKASTAAVCIAACTMLMAQPCQSQPLADWILKSGQWRLTRHEVLMLHQGAGADEAVALCRAITGRGGAWRTGIEPSLGAAEVGLWLQADENLSQGLLATLGGGPASGGGLRLRTPSGDVLWEDRLAPWRPYQPYVVEAVVEDGRARVQLFEADGKTLLSQSPWVDAPAGSVAAPGYLALYTRDGRARFFSWERAETPLSPLVPDAPNNRRLVQDEHSPWVIIGPGNWMWTDATKTRLRQYAAVERSSAILREPLGPEGTWECRVRVSPGAGGAGMLFLTDAEAKTGFIAWLGGEWGNGALMLYRLPLDALWSGAQGCWHYDTDYILRAEARDGQVRVQLFSADGKLLQESPWAPMTDEERTRQGYAGFMTWMGCAEFWGFPGVAGDTQTGQPPAPATAQGQAALDLGRGWFALGDGSWEWADATLHQTARPTRAIALCTDIKGGLGRWKCRARLSQGATAGLVFQASRDAREGFVALLSPDGFRLEDLSGRVLWRDERVRPGAGTEYVIEAEVLVDRVAARLRDGAGNILSESPAVYVPASNNDRLGHVGVLSQSGQAEFRSFAFDR